MGKRRAGGFSPVLCCDAGRDHQPPIPLFVYAWLRAQHTALCRCGHSAQLRWSPSLRGGATAGACDSSCARTRCNQRQSVAPHSADLNQSGQGSRMRDMQLLRSPFTCLQRTYFFYPSRRRGLTSEQSSARQIANSVACSKSAVLLETRADSPKASRHAHRRRPESIPSKHST